MKMGQTKNCGIIKICSLQNSVGVSLHGIFATMSITANLLHSIPLYILEITVTLNYCYTAS